MNDVWLIGISQTAQGEITEQEQEEVTETEAKIALSFIGGYLESSHGNGCYDAKLPQCLSDVLKLNGYFELSFPLGDRYYQINAMT